MSSQYFDEKSAHEYSLPIRIVRFCEIDRQLYDLLRERAPDADPHRDLRVQSSPIVSPLTLNNPVVDLYPLVHR